jgi:hypothetical protein
MKLIVILIMCFIGDETAWVKLLHEIVPMLREDSKSAQIMGELIYYVITKLKLIKLDRGTVENIESIIQGNIFDLVGEQSSREIVDILLTFFKTIIKNKN